MKLTTKPLDGGGTGYFVGGELFCTSETLLERAEIRCVDDPRTWISIGGYSGPGSQLACFIAGLPVRYFGGAVPCWFFYP